MNIVAWRYRPTIGVDKFQWRLTEVPPWKWGPDIAIEQQPLYAKSPQDSANSADVIAALEMALSQAAAMIERQQHVRTAYMLQFYGHECADRCADIALMMTLRTRYEAGDRHRP